jgi:hypothetical protein
MSARFRTILRASVEPRSIVPYKVFSALKRKCGLIWAFNALSSARLTKRFSSSAEPLDLFQQRPPHLAHIQEVVAPVSLSTATPSEIQQSILAG